MKVLIYSDVHGNLPAFEKVIRYECNVDMYISLGDLVNYGPWSDECVELSLSLPNSINIMGNHEQAFINGFYSGKSRLVKEFFNFTYCNFTKNKLIQEFLVSYTSFGFKFTHTINNSYIFPDTSIKLYSDYFIGHSHCQFTLNDNNFTLFNPGSIGQNRNNISKINYALLFSDYPYVKFRSLDYDPLLIVSEMKLRNYPKECTDYYLNKINN